MATTTQRNVVVRMPAVLSVYIGPMDAFRCDALQVAMRTLLGNAFDAAKPIVKRTITSLISFPQMMFRVMGPRFWVQLNPRRHAFIETRMRAAFGNIRAPIRLVTPHRAVKFTFHSRWLNIKRRVTTTADTIRPRHHNPLVGCILGGECAAAWPRYPGVWERP